VLRWEQYLWSLAPQKPTAYSCTLHRKIWKTTEERTCSHTALSNIKNQQLYCLPASSDQTLHLPQVCPEHFFNDRRNQRLMPAETPGALSPPHPTHQAELGPLLPKQGQADGRPPAARSSGRRCPAARSPVPCASFALAADGPGAARLTRGRWGVWVTQKPQKPFRVTPPSARHGVHCRPGLPPRPPAGRKRCRSGTPGPPPASPRPACSEQDTLRRPRRFTPASPHPLAGTSPPPPPSGKRRGQTREAQGTASPLPHSPRLRKGRQNGGGREADPRPGRGEGEGRERHPSPPILRERGTSPRRGSSASPQGTNGTGPGSGAATHLRRRRRRPAPR